MLCDPGEATEYLLQALGPRSASLKSDTENPPVAFVFPGQGAQYINMGLRLYGGEEQFRQAVDRCAEALIVHLGCDLRQLLFPDPSDAERATQSLNDTMYTQPAIFTVSYAIASLLEHWGIRPTAFAGHSIGEFVAATFAGVMELDEALQLVATRGKLMQSLPTGSMLSIRLPFESLVENLPCGVDVAAVNGPQLCVVAGSTMNIEELRQKLTAAGTACRILHTSHAFHSSMMDPVVEPFLRAAESVRLSAPRIPFVSTVTGDWITDQEATDPSYWARHLRSTVQFSKAIRVLLSDRQQVIVECGPRRTCAMLALQHCPPNPDRVIATMPDSADPVNEYPSLLLALGALWLNGSAPNWTAFHGGQKRRRRAIPSYPFQRKRYWIDPGNTTSFGCQSAVPLAIHDSTLATANHSTDSDDRRSDTGDALTLAVLALLEEIYGGKIEVFNPDARFIALGLDSLALTQLARSVRTRLGFEVTFRQLIEQYPTTRLLVDAISANQPEPTAPNKNGETMDGVVVLKEGGERRLFFIYDGEGEVLPYLKLARRMPPEITVLGVLPLRLPRIPQAHTTIPEMAEHCVQVMRRHQPNGPYCLGGLCAGGVIAFEAARQFEQGKERVERVILLDATNPQAPVRPWLTTINRWRRYSSVFGGAQESEMERAYLSDAPTNGSTATLTSAMTKIANVVTYETQRSLDSISVAVRYSLLRNTLVHKRQWPKWIPPMRELDIYTKANRKHEPGTLAADVVLVRATNNGEGIDTPQQTYVEDPLLGWGAHTTGKFDVIDASGGHLSMLTDDRHVEELAHKLLEILWRGPLSESRSH